MQVPGPSFRSGGTIAPFRAVTVDTTADNQVVQVSATTQFACGVSQEGQKGAPGVSGSDTTVAASANDQIEIIGPPNVALLQVSAAVTRGSRMTCDTSGQGLTLAAGSPTRQYVIGIALESASGSGVRIKTWVMPQEVWF